MILNFVFCIQNFKDTLFLSIQVVNRKLLQYLIDPDQITSSKHAYSFVILLFFKNRTAL